MQYPAAKRDMKDHPQGQMDAQWDRTGRSPKLKKFWAKNFQKKVDEPEKMRYTVYC